MLYLNCLLNEDLFADQIEDQQSGASALSVERVALRSGLRETHTLGLPYLPPGG